MVDYYSFCHTNASFALIYFCVKVSFMLRWVLTRTFARCIIGSSSIWK